MTSSTYPTNAIGSVTTNLASTTTTSYPASGTYIGGVTTNIVQRINQTTKPAEGTYVPGTLVQRSNGRWDYRQVTGYTYNQITGYSYQGVTGYTYQGITSYFYQKITGYSYPTIASYTYSQIIGYTRNYSYNVTNFVAETYDMIFSAPGKYEVGTLTGNIRVEAPGVILHVKDSISLTGQDGIRITRGAELRLYVSAPTAKFAGKGFANENGNAASFYYLGLKSNTSLAFGGNASFTGVVYAPYAEFHLGGGGNNTYDFVGAAVAKEIKMNGHFHFHFDENLISTGPNRGYLIYTWNEKT
jgi:hypothetical protein